MLHFMPQPYALLAFVTMFGLPVYVAMYAMSHPEAEFDE
jgi:hypothetical protein